MILENRFTDMPQGVHLEAQDLVAHAHLVVGSKPEGAECFAQEDGGAHEVHEEQRHQHGVHDCEVRRDVAVIRGAHAILGGAPSMDLHIICVSSLLIPANG